MSKTNLYLSVAEAMERFSFTPEQLAIKDFNNYYTGSQFRVAATYKKGKASEVEMSYSRKLKELKTTKDNV